MGQHFTISHSVYLQKRALLKKELSAFTVAPRVRPPGYPPTAGEQPTLEIGQNHETLGRFVQSLFVMRDHRLNQLFLRYRQSGETKALGKLFDKLSPKLAKVARHVAHDEAEAEDLVQATFLAALQHPERFDETRPITAWFVGVLTKEALSWHRQSARRPDADRALEPQTLREEHERPDVQATREESDGLVAAALARLPLRYRDVLERHLKRGLSPSEIAKEQNASPATVRVQLRRGLAQLRLLLPASMAGGLVLALAPRGLAAVKAELVTHALKVAPAAAAAGGSAITTAQLGSFLMAQRIGLGVLGILVLGFLAKLGLDARSENALVSGTGEVTRVLSGLERAKDTQSRERASDRKDAARDTGNHAAEKRVELGSTLIVKSVWADGTPAPNIQFQYESFTANSKIATARTNDEGAISLIGLAPGQYWLHGDRGGQGMGQVVKMTVDASKAREPETNPSALFSMECTLELEPGTDVHGRVVDSNGRGVADAAIWISTGLTRDSGIETTRSASDGSFEIKQLTNACFLGARADGFAPSKPQDVQYWHERLAQGEDVIQLDLQLAGPGARIMGSVLDPSGQPVPNARVRIGAQDLFDTLGPTGAAGPPPPIEVRTDERGEFACGGLAPGAVHVACLSAGYPVAIGTVQVQAGAHGRIELRFTEGAWVRGRVTAKDGTPLERITVSAWQRRLKGTPDAEGSSFDEPRPLTDADGRFAIGPFGGGEIHLSATTQDRKSSASTTVEVASGGEYDWNPSLADLPTIAGFAFDESGLALSNWTVSSQSMSPFGPPPRAVFTKSDGSFELTFSSAGPCRLKLYKSQDDEHPSRMWFAGRAPRAWIDNVETGTNDVRLTLNPAQEPTGVLFGELISESGAATPKLLATVYHDGFGKVAEVEYPSGMTHFEFRNLPAGTLRLRIDSVGYAPIWRREIEMKAGGIRDLGELTIQLGGDIRLALTCENGNEPERVDVKLTDSREAEWYLESNGSSYARDSLPPGEYTVHVQAQDCGPYQNTVTIRSGEPTTLEIALAGGGGIGFVLLGTGSSPLGTDATLTVTTSDGQILFAETLEPSAEGAVGRWIFAPHGELHVTAEATDGRSASAFVAFETTGPNDTPHPLILE